ncbi:MAG: efflux RND transporter permease subunit, partial [Myxococcaceae bacterium]
IGGALRHRGKVYLLTVVFFLGSLALFPLIGIDFMPKTDEGRLQYTLKASPGTSLWATDELFKEAEAIVKKEVPEAEVAVSQFGGGEGFAALFGQNSFTGSLQVRLPSRSNRARSQDQIDEVLRGRFKELSGLEIKPMPQGMAALGGGGDVVVKIFGDDLDQLREYGARVAGKLELTPGAKDINFAMEKGRPELKIELDRDQIKLLGLSPAEVSATISTYFLGNRATMFREAGEEYRVFVRAPVEVRAELERLRALPMVTPRGVTVPLETVAHIEQSLGPIGIGRENQRRLATIAVSADKIPLATLVERVEKAIEAVGPEAGVTTAVAGTAEDLKDSFAALGIAFLVAVLLVYMVMASQFESLLEPFVIFTAIPLSLSGVLIALAVTSTTLQVTALIGIILLAGVVVNNGIVLLDVLKNKRLAGEELVQAAMDAGRSRLRPILMTTLTTVFGMAPLSLGLGDGAELWAPMGRAVIGGMVVSTVLTLVVVPTLYVSLAGWHDRRKARFPALVAAGDGAPPPGRAAAS